MNNVLIIGPHFVTKKYFDEKYVACIREGFAAGKNFTVYVPDSPFGLMTQQLLQQLCIESSSEDSFKRVIVFDTKTKDGRLDKRFELVHGYANPTARDTHAALSCRDEPICVLPSYQTIIGDEVVALLITTLMSDKAQFASALQEFVRESSLSGITEEAKRKLVVGLAHEVTNTIRAHKEM